MNLAELINTIAVYIAQHVSWLLGLAPSEQTIKQLAGAIKIISTAASIYAGYKAARAWLYSGEHLRSAMAKIHTPIFDICTNFDRLLSELGATTNSQQTTTARHKEIGSRPDIVTLSQGRIVTDPVELERVRKELLTADIKKWEKCHLNEAKRNLTATLDSMRQLENFVEEGLHKISLSGTVSTNVLRHSQRLRDLMEVSILQLNTVQADFFPELMSAAETTFLSTFAPFDVDAFAARTGSLLKSCKFFRKHRRSIAERMRRFAARNGAKKQASTYADYKRWAKANNHFCMHDIDYSKLT